MHAGGHEDDCGSSLVAPLSYLLRCPTRLKDSPPPDLGHCVDNEGAVREVKSKVFLAFPPLGYAAGPRSYTLDYQGLSGSLWFRERLWNVLP